MKTLKNKIKGAIPLIGVISMTAGILSVVYWNYLTLAVTDASDAKRLATTNDKRIEVLEAQMAQVAGDTKYIRGRVDAIIDKK